MKKYTRLGGKLGINISRSGRVSASLRTGHGSFNVKLNDATNFSNSRNKITRPEAEKQNIDMIWGRLENYIKEIQFLGKESTTEIQEHAYAAKTVEDADKLIELIEAYINKLL